MKRNRSVWKYALLAIAVTLAIWGQSRLDRLDSVSSAVASTPPLLESDARRLAEGGREQLARGQAEAALNSWQQAEEIYRDLGLEEEVTLSKINRGLAWQGLGNYRQACNILASALNPSDRNNNICQKRRETTGSKKDRDELLEEIERQKDSLVVAVGLRVLGDVLRSLGNLDSSKLVLQSSLEMARDFNSPADLSAILLGLGNTERSLYNRQLDLYERTDSPKKRDKAIAQAQAALDSYQKAVQRAVDIPAAKITRVQGQLNRLSLLLAYEQWLNKEDKRFTKLDSNVKYEISNISAEIPRQLEDLLEDESLFSGLPALPAIYARLNLANSLLQLQKKRSQQDYLKNEARLLKAFAFAEAALQQASELQNKRAKSEALGTLGQLYEQAEQLANARQLTEEALGLAQSIQGWDIAYQWQRQLGRIYAKTGEIERAIATYEVAVDSLDRVLEDLVSIDSDVLFSFQIGVKPLYEELIDLLLESNDPDNLQEATKFINRLQQVELENLLKCSLDLGEDKDNLDLGEDKDNLDLGENRDNNRAIPIVYALVLEQQDKIITILKVTDNSGTEQYYLNSKPWHEVQKSVNALRTFLQDEDLRAQNPIFIQLYARKMYDVLIGYAENQLPPEGTITFVLDSLLGGIPMSLLQDGSDRYLIEKYSIALTSGFQLPETNIETLPWQESAALIAGVSQWPNGSGRSPSRERYSDLRELTPLPFVGKELDLVREQTASSKKLYNQEFTKREFENQVSSLPFAVIHIATHAIFSSDPEQTRIEAYDGGINLGELDRLVRSKTEGSFDAIELLVLSACQTAKGDKRAGLGLAGVAWEAGARTTVASLWNVNDSSTPEFMSVFYQELQAGQTKAEALRQAQIAFLQDRRYQHPYYWAGFVLVGNWL